MRAEGKSFRAIAKELGCDRKTVKRAVSPLRKAGRKRTSMLEPYRPLIRKLVLEDNLRATRVLEEIQGAGYPGKYTVVRDYIRTIRPKGAGRAHERFETEPGEQGQVDLSPYTVLLNGVATKVTCFSMVFGFSRWHFIHFLLHGEARGVCHCHVMAFARAGGVPREILYDRMKQVVLESFDDEVVFHPVFEAMAHHYGFNPVPLAPGYPEGKGKVEKPFQDVEGDFLPGRVFHDVADMNEQAAAWMDRRAQRPHRTTREEPAARLDQERPGLVALPDKPFDAAHRLPRVVGDDYCIEWETNRYSVPPRLKGRSGWARALMGRLEFIMNDDDVEAVHAIRETKFKRYVLPEHEAEFFSNHRRSHVLAEQFAGLGSAAVEFEKGLRAAKRGATGHHLGLILHLAEKVGVGRVAEALRQATRYQAFDAHAVERIVTGRSGRRRSSRVPTTSVLPERLTEYLRGAGDFQRDVEAYEKLSPTHDNKTAPTGQGEPDGKR